MVRSRQLQGGEGGWRCAADLDGDCIAVQHALLQQQRSAHAVADRVGVLLVHAHRLWQQNVCDPVHQKVVLAQVLNYSGTRSMVLKKGAGTASKTVFLPCQKDATPRAAVKGKKCELESIELAEIKCQPIWKCMGPVSRDTRRGA